MNEKYKEMQKAGLAIRIRGLKKEYRLGQIGSTTLQKEIKRWWALKFVHFSATGPSGILELIFFTCSVAIILTV